MSVQLVDFGAEDVAPIEPWFDDAETQKRLGGREWIRGMPSLLRLTIGDEFRGKSVIGRRMWLGLDGSGSAVAFVDTELYDRYVAWDGSDWDHPVVSDAVEVPSAGFVLVVDPARRGQGYGTAAIEAMVAHPDLSHVRLFFGGVEADNIASIRCLTKAGFRPRSTEPDFEGMLYYSRERERSSH
jgi:RimJ/RimL family protein N-acetyltransferase